VIALIAVLVAAADAAPADDEDAAREPEVGAWMTEDRPDDLGGERPRVYAPPTRAAVDRVTACAPPVAAVIAAAYRAAGLADDPTTSWRRRSRLAALIPYVSVRAGQNQAWREVSDPTISHGVAFDLRAAWRLGQLVFDPNEARIAMLDVARRRERRRVASLAVHLYFDWLAAQAAAEQDASAVLDAREKVAELDALTAGWFSEALVNRTKSR
jgi:hypothetical protein